MVFNSMYIEFFHWQMEDWQQRNNICCWYELICAHLSQKKDILIIAKGPINGLDDSKLTAEPQYWINFTKQEKNFCLSLHYNRNNSYLFVNEVKIYQFKAKYFELIRYLLCLGNISENIQLLTWSKQDYVNMSMIFQLIIIVLMLIIF